MNEKDYQYKVCTQCFTFNQAPYIVETMDGFTMQETAFPVVTLVVDDASTDGEPEVIRNYLNLHFQEPYRIEETDYAYIICAYSKTNPNCNFVVFLLKYNHYSIKKTKMPYLKEWLDNAKYHAICEGDDYWLDPKKLQKQVDFLDRNPDYGVCHTGFEKYIQLTGTRMAIERRCVDGWVTYELLKGTFFIATLTTVIRSSIMSKIDTSYSQQNFLMGDLPLWIELSRVSKIKYLPEEMACYRVLQNSASHSSSRLKQAIFQQNVYEIRQFFIEKYSIPGLSNNINDLSYSKAIVYALQRKCYQAFKSYINSHKYDFDSLLLFITRFFLKP